MEGDTHKKKLVNRMVRLLQLVVVLLFVVIGSLIFFVNSNSMNSSSKPAEIISATEVVNDGDLDKIENGVHVRTGLLDAEGMMTVVNNCTNCHSAKLITQNRMSAEQWNETIKWMQETQNLWDLGANQEIIVKYLTTNYPYKKKGRRPILTDIDWYDLED